MKIPNRIWRRLPVLAFALAAAFVLAPDARALTLADLDAGASFSVGPLTFSDFEISVAGALPAGLDAYPVQLLADGFRLAGPLTVTLGTSGTLLISYQVAASEPLIAGARLVSSGVAVGPGAQAWVGESLFEEGGAPLGSLFVYAIEGVGAVSGSSTAFAPRAVVEVAKSIGLASGAFAALPVIDQRFTVVPEPLTLLLLGAGLGGLAHGGRRRASAV